MWALNSSARENGAIAPFSRYDMGMKHPELAALRQECGTGRRRVRVATATPESFGNAEAQVFVRQTDCWWTDDCGRAHMLTAPSGAPPLERLHDTERAYVTFLASGGVDWAMFNEGELYMWTVLHLGLAIANRVRCTLGLRAALQDIEPDYDPTYRELVWTTGQAGRTLADALRGWDPDTSAFLPEATAWLRSADGARGVLPFAMRGRFLLTELKIELDASGNVVGGLDLRMESVALVCRSPPFVMMVHAGFYRLFVLEFSVIVRKMWQGTLTAQDLRMRRDTALLPRPYSTMHCKWHQRVHPAMTEARRAKEGSRAEQLWKALGRHTLLGFVRMAFFRAGYLDMYTLRSLRRCCLRVLQVTDIMRYGGTGRRGRAQAAVHCGWQLNDLNGEQANGAHAYADFDSSDLGVWPRPACTPRACAMGGRR
jgi:hypothetical protein